MDFIEEVDWLITGGIVENYELLTLYNLLKSHLAGLIGTEEMQYEIDSFKSEFYRKLTQNRSYEC